ncbi:sterile alpha motif domain-containing protein 7-like [Salvelinus namaycush]|uniref:Sterile alpha motif domain-containing protein 7-like n=1 Tax=Salvelinus namaycush TaxID=8040 RepID=A0A8U1BVW1_SALNM|nr:sterile alpha motif domain-containing protein 7-like [Salvelinus namaycush]
MTPREQLRKMSAMGEQGALDEKHWYRLVNGMSAGELCQRQEMMMRNQIAMAPQILAQGQQRLQGVPTQFEPRFMERELVPPSEMGSSEARQMHMGGHLGPPMPPHPGISGRGFPGVGYSFMPSEPMETVARRHELIHKQNVARMEMNAILHQKEMENAHQRGLMGMDAPMMYQSNAMALRGRQRLPDGHDFFVHRTTLEEMQANNLLMSSSPYPPISTLQRERGRRAGRRATNHKSAESHASGHKGQSEGKRVEQSPGGASGDEKEAEGKMDMGGEAVGKQHQAKMDTELSSNGRKSYKEAAQGLRKACINSQDGCPDVTNCNSGASDKDRPSQCSAFQYPSASGPIPGMPYMFPPGECLLSTGPPNLFLNGQDMSSVEDLRKWTVDDVYIFIKNMPSCSEYAQTFKDHMIDGETLPFLTEDHLLDTMGLKLGPALKIRSRVSSRLGSMFYMMSLPLSAAAALQATPENAGGDRSSEISSPVYCNGVEMMGSPCTRDPEGRKPTDPLPETDNPSPPSASSETA